MDDIVLTVNSQETIDKVLHSLGRTFAIKDIDIKPVSSPMAPNTHLARGDSAIFNNPVKYRQVVGALRYVTLSRPDISLRSTKCVSSCNSLLITLAKRILRYLPRTTDFCLRFQLDSGTCIHAYTYSTYNSLIGFSDADWAGCPDDRRSTRGYDIYLGSNLVSWFARKQKTVSRSLTELEYKALADTVATYVGARFIV
ncbi:uncharacterized mitochondrial protein AtMg00810-like [Rutidosis leptorrhynchoides]|uniref:uncharacterized mitochondrial protein AtMg00810-like n=1 Tax=Rutidosis leptorrhynchoides TaxID=125765 RepID=UPI003A9A018B